MSSIQANEPSEIQILPTMDGRSCSFNELLMQKKNAKPAFYSHSCLPLQGFSRDSSSESSSDDD